MGVIRWLLRFAFLGMILFIGTAVAMLLKSAEIQDDYGGPRGIPEPVDVAIVLGGGTKPDLILDFATRQRVRMGAYHLSKGNVDWLIMTGGPMGKTDVTAASVMRDFAVDTGADSSQILLEERARTTFENLRLSFEMMDARGLTTFAIVSDDYHLARARELARFMGRKPGGLGAARSLYYAPRAMQITITLRETAAWGYNVLKASAWWVLGQMGYSEAERAQRIF